jgi:hypothetical protein
MAALNAFTFRQTQSNREHESINLVLEEIALLVAAIICRRALRYHCGMTLDAPAGTMKRCKRNAVDIGCETVLTAIYRTSMRSGLTTTLV